MFNFAFNFAFLVEENMCRELKKIVISHDIRSLSIRACKLTYSGNRVTLSGDIDSP